MLHRPDPVDGWVITAADSGWDEALGPLDDTVLLRTSGMRRNEIDAERRIARVEAGVVGGT